MTTTPTSWELYAVVWPTELLPLPLQLPLCACVESAWRRSLHSLHWAMLLLLLLLLLLLSLLLRPSRDRQYRAAARGDQWRRSP